MLYLLINHNREWLEAHNLGFLRVFTFVTFQATAAMLVSFVIVLIFGNPVINWLRRKKIGDLAQFDDKRMNEMMAGKAGVPTMGGILIIAAIATTVLLLANLANFYVQMALVCLVWLGAVGAIDDWLKLTKLHRSGTRDGLSKAEKLLFQFGLGMILSIFTFYYGRDIEPNHTLYFPFFKQLQIPLNLLAFVVISTIIIVYSSNAVNLTDGLDGLAAGCVGIVSFTLLILALVIGTLLPHNDPVLNVLLLPYIRGSDQMAVLAAAMTGACLGFLWFNCHPARVFMGDTGSLALGGLVGYIAIVIRQELLLLIIGGIFVAEAVSVMLQVGWFKYTKKRFGEGRRVFLMAPLHHHFQKKGWAESQVVVRFWLVGAMLAAMALATVKLR